MSNTTAIRLYEKMGFAKEGEFIRHRKIDGTYDNALMMARFLID